jgi:hypothetical protein
MKYVATLSCRNPSTIWITALMFGTEVNRMRRRSGETLTLARSWGKNDGMPEMIWSCPPDRSTNFRPVSIS